MNARYVGKSNGNTLICAKKMNAMLQHWLKYKKRNDELVT